LSRCGAFAKTVGTPQSLRLNARGCNDFARRAGGLPADMKAAAGVQGSNLDLRA